MIFLVHLMTELLVFFPAENCPTDFVGPTQDTCKCLRAYDGGVVTNYDFIFSKMNVSIHDGTLPDLTLYYQLSTFTSTRRSYDLRPQMCRSVTP